jgi:hypothetical protein
MKTISWIDKVAPGVAHQFVNLLFVLACFSLFNSLMHAAPPINPFGQAIACVLVVFWIFCLKQLPGLIARICLGISAGVSFALFACVLIGALFHLFSSGHLFFGFMGLAIVLLLLGIPLAGFGSLLWTSLRPPVGHKLPSNFRGLILFSNY